MSIGITGRIARTSARRPWLTIGVWGVVIAGAIALAGALSGFVTPAGVNLVETESDRATALENEWRGLTDGFSESVIVTSDEVAAGDAAFDAVVAAAAAELRAIDGVTAIVTPDGGAPVAPNGRSALITFVTPADTGALAAAVDAVDSVSTPQVEAFVFGDESMQLALNELANEELARSEGIGIVAALVILVLVFGAVVAAGLPLAMALASIAVASGLGLVVARVTDALGAPMSDSITIFTGMLGLALGIDYSLLTVQRFREELANGRTVEEAVIVTGDTANRAVLLSGGTVVIALGGLLVIPLNTFLGIGVGVMAVAVAAVAAALTLMPAVLTLIGPRVDRLRVRRVNSGHESPRWRRIATLVASRPAIAGGLGIATLLVLAAPTLSLRFAAPEPSAWPEDFVLHRANDAIVEDFGWTQDETVIAVEGASAAVVQALAGAVEADPGYSGTTIDDHGDVAFIDTHDVYTTGDEEATAALERLRESLIPAALAGTDATASVGGSQASALDEQRLMTDATPRAIAIILGATFVLLLVTFRSIVVPLKAIALNILGTLATFGVVVAAFQWGWGSGLGLPEISGVSVFMPVMTFALVFGLSMDYHVFLLSRIKEHVDRTGDTRGAVIEGLTRTGPLITGAALIMIAVFGGFATASIPELSQWGLGLAVGVLIDATIIRVLLVPASMAWLGEWNWYLPRWLEWLPRFQHEREAELEPALVPAVRR